MNDGTRCAFGSVAEESGDTVADELGLRIVGPGAGLGDDRLPGLHGFRERVAEAFAPLGHVQGHVARGIEGLEQVEVGDDAAMVLQLRRTLNDVEFEATMRDALGLTW